MVPLTRYHCEGVYLLNLFDTADDLFRCEARPGHKVACWKDNTAYRREPLLLTADEFTDALLGQVAFYGRVIAGGLLPEEWVQ